MRGRKRGEDKGGRRGEDKGEEREGRDKGTGEGGRERRKGSSESHNYHHNISTNEITEPPNSYCGGLRR